jgi:hypothetical protein
MDTTHFIIEGIGHITDPGGYDHMLFLLALSCNLEWFQWKKTLWLVTAFTLGHSITLGLSAAGLIAIGSDLIELLIAISILMTALAGLMAQFVKRDFGIILPYVITTFFGFIHGAGFSAYFKMIASDSEFIGQLFQFNLGVEIGQIIILAIITTIRFISKEIQLEKRFNQISLVLASLLSIMMVIDRI